MATTMGIGQTRDGKALVEAVTKRLRDDLGEGYELTLLSEEAGTARISRRLDNGVANLGVRAITDADGSVKALELSHRADLTIRQPIAGDTDFNVNSGRVRLYPWAIPMMLDDGRVTDYVADWLRRVEELDRGITAITRLRSDLNANAALVGASIIP